MLIATLLPLLVPAKSWVANAGRCIEGVRSVSPPLTTERSKHKWAGQCSWHPIRLLPNRKATGQYHLVQQQQQQQ